MSSYIDQKYAEIAKHTAMSANNTSRRPGPTPVSFSPNYGSPPTPIQIQQDVHNTMSANNNNKK